MPLWTAPLVALALTQIAALATSVYLHRTLAHRALAVHPVVDHGPGPTAVGGRAPQAPRVHRP